MPTFTESPIERFARTQHDTAAGWLQRRFVKLSAEDIADVLGSVYEDALTKAKGTSDKEFSAWFYTALNHKAIDLVRTREGRGEHTRARAVSIDALATSDSDGDADAALADAIDTLISEGVPTDQQTEVVQLLDAKSREHNDAAVRRALNKLPEEHASTLRLWFFDLLSIDSAAEVTARAASRSATCAPRPSTGFVPSWSLTRARTAPRPAGSAATP